MTFASEYADIVNSAPAKARELRSPPVIQNLFTRLQHIDKDHSNFEKQNGAHVSNQEHLQQIRLCATNILARCDLCITFEIHVDTVLAAPWLALADDDGGHDLLTEIGLPLLDGGHHHIADAGGRETVEAPLDALDGDDVEVLGPRVVGAVHRRRHRQTQ
jgi:hypothetical protein